MPRPILLNSCARAATAAETRYRIDAPITPTRGTRVVALDPGAEAVVRRVAAQRWFGARFFSCVPRGHGHPDGAVQTGRYGGIDVADLMLVAVDGSSSRLSVELDGADVAMMIATADAAAAAASAIGDACTLRGIMTAGLVIAGTDEAAAAVSALRPHARVLMVTQDERDVSDLLTALRA
jgi:hypothetical protein